MIITDSVIINYEEIVTKEDLLKLENEDVNFINSESFYQGNILRKYSSSEYLKKFMVKRAKEIAFLAHKYSSKSNVEKELIAANIVFNDDEAFIRALLSKGINFNRLFYFSRLISNVKKNAILNGENTEDIEKAKLQINNLCKCIHYYFGIKDYDLIIAKLNDILVFKSELYREIELQTKQKVKTH